MDKEITFNLEKLDGENSEQFIWRLCSAKDSGELDMSWDELSEVFNRELDIPEDRQQGEASFRKPYQYSKQYYENVFLPMLESKGENWYVEQMVLEKEGIHEAKVQLSDQRRAYTKRMRENARINTRIDVLEDTIIGLSEYRYEGVEPGVKVDKGNDLLVMLSDMHIGINYASFNGSYSIEIARQRASRYMREVIAIGERHGSQNVYVTVLGDNISGNIHRSIDVENEETVIDQIKIASEIVADFVVGLSEHFASVHVNSVSGNHSRLMEKSDAALSERLDDILAWYVKCATTGLKNIHVQAERKWGGTVTMHEIRGGLYASVHGDMDELSAPAIRKLISWLGCKVNAVCIGHRHTPFATTVDDVWVIQSGSLSGAGDEYTTEKRLTGHPSQMVCVVDEDGIQTIYPVQLDKANG